MFTRIRVAIDTLRSEGSPSGRTAPSPDIVFVEAQPEASPSRLSKVLGSLVAVVAVTTFFALIGRMVGDVSPKRSTTDVGTIVGVLTSLAMFAWQWISQRAYHRLHLAIGSTIAPAFGHKIREAYDTLKSPS